MGHLIWWRIIRTLFSIGRAEAKRFMLALLFLLILLPLGVGALQTSRSIVSYGMISYEHKITWLHTDGKLLKDATGRTVLLRGCSWHEYMWGSRPHQDPVVRMKQMGQYGVTVIRLCLNPAYWLDKTHWDHKAYINRVDQIVQLAKNQSIYLIMDFHKLGEGFSDTVAKEFMLNPSEVSVDGKTYNVTDFFIQLANRYINETHVAIFQLIGQPPHDWNKTHWDIWWNNALYLAKAIHAVNPNIIISVASMVSERITQNFIDNPLPEPNIIYEFHRYYHYDIGYSDYANSYAAGDLELAKRQQKEYYYNQVGLKMLDAGYPVFAIEFGATRTDPYWDVQIQDLYDLLAEYGVSWTQWTWYTQDFALFGLLESDWQTFTPEGQIWAQNLLKY